MGPDVLPELARLMKVGVPEPVAHKAMTQGAERGAGRYSIPNAFERQKGHPEITAAGLQARLRQDNPGDIIVRGAKGALRSVPQRTR